MTDTVPSPVGKSPSLIPVTLAWLALLALTGLSLWLGERFHASTWLQAAVALIVWLKGSLVAHSFLESCQAHPFIRRLLQVFVAFTPLALLGLAFFGSHFARWATL